MIRQGPVGTSEHPGIHCHKLWPLFPAVLLSCLSVYFFVKAADLVWYQAFGPPTRINWVNVLSFCWLAALALAALFVALVIRVTQVKSRGLRFLARYFLALLLCTLIFGAAVWIIRMLRMT